MQKLKQQVLISSEQIAERVKAIAQEILQDDTEKNKDLVIVGVLKGSLIFHSDLIRALSLIAPHLSLASDFMRVSSYGTGKVSSGTITFSQDVEINLNDKNVILVEDIIDSGNTIAFLKQHLAQKFPQMKSLRICSFLARKDKVSIVDYIGFTIGKSFVVGYGLDLAEEFRQLPYIAELLEVKEEGAATC